MQSKVTVVEKSSPAKV